MTQPINDTDDTRPMSDRYADLAIKSAAKAEVAMRQADLASGAEDPRACKRARREAKEWAEQTTLDAMRANGALSAESGVFEAKHPRAEEAMRLANAARDKSVQIYRELRGGGSDD